MTTTEGILPRIDGKEVLTYSAIASFRNCARKFDLRYQHWLLPDEQAEALVRGSVIHDALEAFYKVIMAGDPNDLSVVAEANAAMKKTIDNRCDGHAGDDRMHDRWHHAHAIAKCYVDRWTAKEDFVGQVVDDEYELLAIEHEFVSPIVNPDTGRPSATFVMAGKVDGIIRFKSDGHLYVLERKTAAEIDEGYLAKLWSDFQSMLYASYLGKLFGEQFRGVLYDVMRKSRHAQKAGESQQKFEERLASYKTQKTIDKHLAAGPKPSETDEEFRSRLQEVYSSPNAQHRELIYFDEDRLRVVQEEVWDITKQILAARKRGRFGMNTSNCYAFNRACSFTQICRAGRLDEMTSQGLSVIPPHRELELVNPGGSSSTQDDLPF